MSFLDSLSGPLCAIPPGLQRLFAPAARCLFEWRDYYLELPGADRLRVGTRWLVPVQGDVFHLRFENQLGLSVLQIQRMILWLKSFIKSRPKLFVGDNLFLEV
jgi:hypothetical protein